MAGGGAGDVVARLRRWLAPLKHKVTLSLLVMRRQAARNGVRIPDKDYSLAVPLGYDVAPAPVRIGVVVQMFYPDLADEMRARLDALPEQADLFLTVPSETARATVAAAFAGWDRGTVEVRIIENRGRDIPTKIIAFCDVLASYDLLLLLHSKRSVAMSAGGDWRATLMDALLGSRRTVDSIIALFEADPKLGIVAPQHFEPMRRWLGWAGCDATVTRLVTAMGGALVPGRPLDFVSGTMFWARPAAIAPLIGLGLKIEDFEPEPMPLGATLAHAVERLLLYSAEIAGFGWVKVAAPARYRHQRQILSVDEPAALPDAMAKAAYRLLEQPAVASDPG